MKKIEELYDQIYLSNWESLIKKIPSCSIDLVITSPPYNVSLGNNKKNKNEYDTYEDNLLYTEYLEWMTKLFYECNRILKLGGRLCINVGDGANGKVPQHADFIHIMINQMKDSEYDSFENFKMLTTIIWDKCQIGNATAWGSFKSPRKPSFPTPFEYVIVVSKGDEGHEGDEKAISVTKENFIRNSRALWRINPEIDMKKWDHPAMFPEELPRRLIDQLTYIGDIVYDPFSGAFTTCSVAKKMGRHYIGCDISEKYYEKGIARLSTIPDFNFDSFYKNNVVIPKWMFS